FGECLAFDQLENEGTDACTFFETVNRADVRVVERRQYPRLPLEACQARRVTHEEIRQDLDRDLASERRVVRAIYLPHRTGAEQCSEMIGADAAAGQLGGVSICD